MNPTDPGPILITSGYVQVGDLNMYYEIGGEGQPLVMLHGGMLQSGVLYLFTEEVIGKAGPILGYAIA